MFKLEKQPMTIQKKIKHHMKVISELNSTELLNYSKALKRLKHEIGVDVLDYLFRAIELRTVTINSGLQKKQECREKMMVEEFLKARS